MAGITFQPFFCPLYNPTIMKRPLSFALMMLLAISSVFAQNKNRVSPHTTVNGNNFSITYGQPSVKGRVIFGTKEQHALQPYGEVWRAGADEATEISIKKDCLFEGRKLAAGTYSLFVIPGKFEWTVILNSELKQWGSFNYEKIKDHDVIVAAVAAKRSDKIVETFTITPQGNGFKMEWEHMSASVDIKPIATK
jgi:Protein of unknown function (DUF2911)